MWLKRNSLTHMMGIYYDSFIDEYQKLTNLVHSYDSKIIMQIAYGEQKLFLKVEKKLFILQAK